MTDKQALQLPPMNRRMQAFSIVVFFLLGALLAAFVFANPFGLSFLPGGSSERHPPPKAAVEEPPQLYQCPMHPEVIQPEPGDCPICGMALQPIESAQPKDEAAGAEPSTADVRIDPRQIQNTGVVSVPVRRQTISQASHTVGILDFNADNITWINTKFEGWIEKVYISYVGQRVSRGQSLFEIYSPELVTTQEEYVRALEYKTSLEHAGRAETLRQAESLVASTRDRLTYWDISEDQISRLEQTRKVQRQLTVLAPTDGLVAEVMDEALEGMFVQPGMNLYRIADLSTIWVHADVYEADMQWVHPGQQAEIRFRNDPTQVFRGNVLFLYPEVSRDTRTLKICVEMPNPDGRLRPGMYADVTIEGPPVLNALVIPQSAVLRSGERDLVFVDMGEGRFQPREITLGVATDGELIHVLDGLSAGQRVVTQAQFMLDSESRIQEAIAKFRKRGEPTADHRH